MELPESRAWECALSPELLVVGVSRPAGLHPGPAGGRTRLPSTPRLTEGQRARRQTQVPLGQG